MSKPRPDKLLKFGEIIAMLAAEVFASQRAALTLATQTAAACSASSRPTSPEAD